MSLYVTKCLCIMCGMKRKWYHVKIGSDRRPASQADIDHIKAEFEKVAEDTGDNIVVTHHLVEVTEFGESRRRKRHSKILPW